MINDGVELRQVRETRLFLVSAAEADVCVPAPVLCFLNTFAAHRAPDLRLHARLIYRNDDEKFIFIRGRVRAILAATNAPETDSQKR